MNDVSLRLTRDIRNMCQIEISVFSLTQLIQVRTHNYDTLTTVSVTSFSERNNSEYAFYCGQFCFYRLAQD